ncbi:Txe/YoeB family addiction module toxin [Arthrobacter sp.]|uniref:Txe/YoeB family addiction module toxin n=1 Tax=Arthrobacter sp. TaxID=1667 RepID=UPI003A9450BA
MLLWSDAACDDYLIWQTEDRRILKRINSLIRDVQRNGNHGIGKPEPLKHALHGYWSRRIDQEHRLVYRIDGDDVLIAACRFHY